MTQFAEQIQVFYTAVRYPVLDATGLEGAWDFTIAYSPLMNLSSPILPRDAQAADTVGNAAVAPSGGTSFIDAVEKQLGLKLEMHKPRARLRHRPHPGKADRKLMTMVPYVRRTPTDSHRE